MVEKLAEVVLPPVEWEIVPVMCVLIFPTGKPLRGWGLLGAPEGYPNSKLTGSVMVTLVGASDGFAVTYVVLNWAMPAELPPAGCVTELL